MGGVHVLLLVFVFAYDAFYHQNDYRNYPKFSDRYAWANSADPDQRSSLIRVWVRVRVRISHFAIPSASF